MSAVETKMSSSSSPVAPKRGGGAINNEKTTGSGSTTKSSNSYVAPKSGRGRPLRTVTDDEKTTSDCETKTASTCTTVASKKARGRPSIPAIDDGKATGSEGKAVPISPSVAAKRGLGHPNNSNKTIAGASKTASTTPTAATKRGRGRSLHISHSVSAVEYLKAWMMSPEHIAHPYPTKTEKTKMVADTGIFQQLDNWFAYTRKRHWKPPVDSTRGPGRPRETAFNDGAKAKRAGPTRKIALSDDNKTSGSGDDSKPASTSPAVAAKGGSGWPPQSAANKDRKDSNGKAAAFDYLKAWMMSPEHIAHPYPTKSEKAKMMADTGMELKQLDTWFVNNRKRYWKPQVGNKLQSSVGKTVSPSPLVAPKMGPGRLRKNSFNDDKKASGMASNPTPAKMRGPGRPRKSIPLAVRIVKKGNSDSNEPSLGDHTARKRARPPKCAINLENEMGGHNKNAGDGDKDEKQMSLKVSTNSKLPNAKPAADPTKWSTENGGNPRKNYKTASSEIEATSSSGGKRERVSTAKGKAWNTNQSNRIGAQALEYLTDWMTSPDHIVYPYPTDPEKAKMMADTGMELKQLNTWFSNYRKRYWKPRVAEKFQSTGSYSTSSSNGVQGKVKTIGDSRIQVQKSGSDAGSKPKSIGISQSKSPKRSPDRLRKHAIGSHNNTSNHYGSGDSVKKKTVLIRSAISIKGRSPPSEHAVASLNLESGGNAKHKSTMKRVIQSTTTFPKKAPNCPLKQFIGTKGNMARFCKRSQIDDASLNCRSCHGGRNGDFDEKRSSKSYGHS
ncbi:unnamed protein product [Cylindrotheca closterium]|uniref:Homeobox domain-containing protein n=1 Tax=Cylindrotheca closterium TaxID=2856 RepID=A0AAD2FPK5_9STRA|nr:unnamed protein product [Cylindrotheca closterium]